MKKSLIALAVLAASGAAMAQSSVTMYGVADVWLGSVKIDTGVAATSSRTTKIDTGGAASTRWGIMGSEDLGGGLKANFKMEQGVNLDTGVAGTNGSFSRQAYVGFSGGFGEVRLGHTTTAYDDISGASDALFDSDLSPMNSADAYSNVPAVFTSQRHTSRPTNMVYYATPNMSGFSGALSYGLNETDDVTVGTSNTSLHLKYAAGPLAAQLGYQVQDTDGQASKISFTRLGASYNFGMATAKFVYGSVKNASIETTALTTGSLVFDNGAKTTDYLIGLDVPVGTATTVSVAYANSDDNAAAGNAERSGYGIAALYNLSKRTSLYGGYKAMKHDFNVGPDAKITILAAGVVHKF